MLDQPAGHAGGTQLRRRVLLVSAAPSAAEKPASALIHSLASGRQRPFAVKVATPLDPGRSTMPPTDVDAVVLVGISRW